MDFDTCSIDCFKLLIFDELKVLTFEIIHILDSNKFGVYLTVIGLCMSIMDHYNKAYSNRFEAAMLIVFHKFKKLSLCFLLTIKLSIIGVISYNIYKNENVFIKYFPNAELYQSGVIIFAAGLLLINIFILLVYVIDFRKGNQVTAVALLFMATGFYYETREVECFYWIAAGLGLFTCFVIIGSFNESYKENSKN